MTFFIKKGCEQPITVYADKEKIRQVLINLVENAIKYGNAEGNIEAGVYRTDNSVLIEITDDGIGIAEEHLSRIFERFFRTDYGRSRNIGGSMDISFRFEVNQVLELLLDSHSINIRNKKPRQEWQGVAIKRYGILYRLPLPAYKVHPACKQIVTITLT